MELLITFQNNTDVSPKNKGACELMNLPPMQLQMSIPAEVAVTLPPWKPPDGYIVRGYQPDDEDGWLRLMELAGFGGWDRAKLESYLAEPERRDGSRVIVCDTDIVAATFASRRSVEPPVGALDYVIGHPEHKGRQLGCCVCAAVVCYLVSRGYERIVLSTDDWRLPALKTYLKLGFLPNLCREDMPDRWRAIYQKLDFPSPFLECND